VCMGKRRSVQSVLVGRPEEKNHLGGPGVDVRIILRCMFRNCFLGLWTRSSWHRIGTCDENLGMCQ
jgi:hypothetical protein